MITFEKAIEVATENAKNLIENAYNFALEGVILSDDNKLYEVSLSYDIRGKNPLDIKSQNNEFSGGNGLYQLARIMSYRRETKVFLVGSYDGKFRGFKNQK